MTPVLPVICVEFRQISGSPGVVLDRVIPDTGADASVLPWTDCQLLQLTPSLDVQGLIGGVAGGSAATLAFQIWARLDGQDYPCRLQADFAGGERIVGRDVLNRLEILFRGPVGEVVVNPRWLTRRFPAILTPSVLLIRVHPRSSVARSLLERRRGAPTKVPKPVRPLDESAAYPSGAPGAVVS